MSKQIMRIFFIVSVFFALPDFAKAATHYVSPDGNDANSGLQIDLPKEHITSAMQDMASGDTLILKDGVYSGLDNMIGDYSVPKVLPPSGTSDNYTVIKAENEGRAIIDGEYITPAFSNSNLGSERNYLRIEGIHFRHGSCSVFSLKGNYNKVIKCGFEDGQAPDDESQCSIANIAGGSSYSLVEDSWVWGKGRYGLYTASPIDGTNHIIFRRVVVRQDSTPLAGPASAISFYNAHDNVAQNVVVLDSKLNPATAYIYGAFGTGGASTADTERNHAYYGVIALNNELYSGFSPYKLGSTTTISNSIFWGNGSYGITSGPTDSGDLNINHNTIGRNGLSGVRSNSGYTIVFNVDNTISAENSQYGYSYANNVRTTNTFGNSLGACYFCEIINGIDTDPFLNASGYENPGLKYLPRIESGSNLSGAASDGKDIGANILYRIGENETLYGDSGWNDTTSVKLWPFNNERLWVDKMQEYTASGPGGDRGFASSGVVSLNGLSVNIGMSQSPLTEYIWNYLGNIPIMTADSIYGDYDTIAPSAPGGLSVN